MVLMLVGVKDVGAEFKEQAGDAGDESRLIRAVEEQDGGFKVLAGHASRVMERRPMGVERTQAETGGSPPVMGLSGAGPLRLGKHE